MRERESFWADTIPSSMRDDTHHKHPLRIPRRFRVMESRMQNRGCLRAQGRSPVNFLAAIVLLCCATGTVNGAATGTFKKLFVVGDSYADTGNRDPNNATYTPIGPVNQAWRPPYGRKTPGSPAGHFSDGHVLSEFLGEYMGLNPATYRKYKLDSSTPTADGMNFAVGGSGVFDNLGFTKTSDQIAQLKALLDANVFNRSSVFNESVILFAISGNDYASMLRNPLSSPNNTVTRVVDQMVQDLKSLYDLGFRNFVISELPPLDCLPTVTATLGYITCVFPVALVPTLHNSYLTTAIAVNFLPSSQANFIFLNNQAAFLSVIYNPVASGFLFPLKPCCVAQSGKLCGDVNSNNNPLYTLCSNSSSPTPFFWDENHPTEAGWRNVFALYKAPYTAGKSYTHDKSLPAFLGVS